MNKLIVLSGVPGSGKSYFCERLKQRMKSHVYIISSDELRTIIGGSRKVFTNEDLMWEMYYKLIDAYALDPNGIVVLDSTNSLHKFRIDKIKPYKHLFKEIDLVIWKLDKKTVFYQNEHREFPIPSEALEKLYSTHQDADKIDYDFYHNVFVIENNNIDLAISSICN